MPATHQAAPALGRLQSGEERGSIDGRCSPATGRTPGRLAEPCGNAGGCEMAGRMDPAGLPDDRRERERHVTSFIKTFLEKLRNGQSRANSGGASLLASCAWVGAPVLRDGKEPGQRRGGM